MDVPHRVDHPGGDGAVAELLRGERLPSAIFAGNDRCAHGVLATLRRTGVLVPDDVSVVGYDDSGVARLSFIDLTTVRQDVTRMAEAALEAIVERLSEAGRRCGKWSWTPPWWFAARRRRPAPESTAHPMLKD